MVSLMSLLLPIVIATVFVFIVSSILHMVSFPTRSGGASPGARPGSTRLTAWSMHW